MNGTLISALALLWIGGFLMGLTLAEPIGYVKPEQANVACDPGLSEMYEPETHTFYCADPNTNNIVQMIQ